MSVANTSLQRLNQLLDLCGLHNVVVHLSTNGLQCCFECRKAGNDESCSVRLNAPHRADQGESVSGCADVEIREQRIVAIGLNCIQTFGDRCCYVHFEYLHFQDRRQSHAYIRLIVNEENFCTCHTRMDANLPGGVLPR